MSEIYRYYEDIKPFTMEKVDAFYARHYRIKPNILTLKEAGEIFTSGRSLTSYSHVWKHTLFFLGEGVVNPYQMDKEFNMYVNTFFAEEWTDHSHTSPFDPRFSKFGRYKVDGETRQMKDFDTWLQVCVKDTGRGENIIESWPDLIQFLNTL